MPKKEPAIWVGIIAAAVLAALSSLSGNGIINADILATIQQAFDPASGGWALPIIVGLITRFFVSPASSPGL